MDTQFNPNNPATYSSQNPQTLDVNTQPVGTANPNYQPGTAPATAPVAPANNVVQTASAAQSQYTNLSGGLQNMLNQLNQQPDPNATPKLDVKTYSDPFTQALDAQSTRGNNATKALVSSIQAQNQNMRNSLGTQNDEYKRGLQLLGIQHNEAQSSPDLLMGHIQQVQNDYTQKIQQLNAEEARTLMEAENARSDKNLSILKEKMDYVKQVQKEKDNALSDMYTKMSTETKIGDAQAHQIYDQLQKLPPADKQTFIQAVAKKYGISLQTLVTSLADEQKARIKVAKTGNGSSFVLKDKIAEVSKGMQSVVGTDGYIDPYKYIKARDRWNSLGGSTSSFNSNFKRFVNPDSYTLAGL